MSVQLLLYPGNFLEPPSTRDTISGRESGDGFVCSGNQKGTWDLAVKNFGAVSCGELDCYPPSSIRFIHVAEPLPSHGSFSRTLSIRCPFHTHRQTIPQKSAWPNGRGIRGQNRTFRRRHGGLREDPVGTPVPYASPDTAGSFGTTPTTRPTVFG